MDKQAMSYLKETLFQAKRFGLSAEYIQNLEAKYEQIQKRK